MNIVASIILESLYLWPVALGVCVAVTAAVVWLYPPQVRGNGWGGWLTLGLRWVAMIALAAAMLKPVMLQPGGVGEGDGVDVLVDCSQSMGVVDTGRTIAQRVALAAALGRLPDGVRSDAGAGLLDRVRQVGELAQGVVNAQGDLDYARVVGRGISERQSALRAIADRYAVAARVLAGLAGSAQTGSEVRGLLEGMEAVPDVDQRRAWADRISIAGRLRDAVMALQTAADEQLYASDSRVRQASDSLLKLSRLQLAEEAMLRPGGLVNRLSATGPVHEFAIEKDLKAIHVESRFARGGIGRLRPDGKGSNLTAAVGAAVAGAAERSVRAVVVFSDGCHTGGRGDVISAIRPSGVPVFSVGVAAPVVADAWISSVALPSEAFAGETLDGQVEVRRQNMAEAPRTVTISSASGTQVVRLQPRMGSDGKPLASEFTARFGVLIDPPGGAPADRVAFSIEQSPEEVSAENNHVERWVKVSSARLRVAGFTGSATWDFQSLRTSLSRRQWVRLDAQVMDANHPRLAMKPEDILSEDVVILHDVPVDALDVNQWDAVSRLVNDRGGSVIIIPGNAASVADWARQPIAAALLPFHDLRPTWKQWPGEQPAFRFTPTPLGERLALRLGEGAEAQHRWQELPAVYRFLQIPDKDLYGDVRKLLLETDSGSAVLTERQLNRGRAFFVGLDEIWRWRLKAGERDGDRFWRQLVRHAAGEPYAASRGGVALDVSTVSCEPGESVRARARVRGGAGASARTLAVQITRGPTPIRTVQLPAEGGGRFSGPIPALAEGDYQLEVNITARGRADVVAVPLHVGANDELEMQNLSGDPELLRRIARASGGHYLTIDEIDQLPGRLTGVHDADSQLIRRPLYNSPLLFVFVLACLSGEWALRKRQGLA